MSAVLTTLLALSAVAGAPIETYCVQVAPVPRPLSEAVRSPNRERAVLLVHGLRIHPFNRENVNRATLHDWQKPHSLMVTRLSKDSDVYSFAYAQNAAVDDVANVPDLKASIQHLRQLGYRSVVLVGYSAGGLVVRRYVEDVADCGVDKVIQVCPPNGGSGWAQVKAVQPDQIDFMNSLTKQARRQTQRDRGGKKIPDNIQFACIVGTGAVNGDGLVLTRCQWTDDLQRQGIPVYPVLTSHWQVVRVRHGADLLAELVREPQPRWSARLVAVVRQQLLGD
jgi:pimeloyl-ACP methyl ester carboxylesterase